MNQDEIRVTKRSGETEPLDLNKIHKVLEWATEDITGVSVSEIELRANIQLYDLIPAYDIHELLIKSSAELISEDTPNYQFVAARLINYKIRKEVYGQYEPWPLRQLIEVNIDRGVYDPEILDWYTDEEIEELDRYIKHKRDDTFAYAGMEQMRGKYLAQDRLNKIPYETPQAMYMLIAMTLFSVDPDTTNTVQHVKDYYDAVSTYRISLPTPIMAGARTPIRQFSSCVLIESEDSLKSINATASSIVEYASKKAGIGIGASSIRAEGSPVGDGSVIHTGCIPFFRYWRGALKSCSQGGVRGASANLNYLFWHREIEDLLVLKNNKGTYETRIRDLDYTVHLNSFFYQRVREDGWITLFSPHEVPQLFEAFYSDQARFAELYEKYERKTSLNKKKI